MTYKERALHRGTRVEVVSLSLTPNVLKYGPAFRVFTSYGLPTLQSLGFVFFAHRARTAGIYKPPFYLQCF